MKTRTQIIILASVLALVGLLIAGYLALIYVPAWYQPESIAPTDQQVVRDQFDRYRDRFNNSMQRPAPFEFTLAARDLNRFLSGLAYFDPALKDAIPSNVMDPAVQLEDDYLKVGAVVEQDGKKVFASFWLKVSPQGEWLVVDDLRVRIGLYPVPREMMQRRIEKISGRLAKQLPGLEEVLAKRRYPNRFRYPNSDYDFRVTSLQARDGVLHAMIEPVPRERRQ